MKVKKIIYVSLLITVFIFALSHTSIAVENINSSSVFSNKSTVKHIHFSDVEKTKHSNAIKVLAGIGILGGYPDGTFHPDEIVERDVMAKLLFVTATASYSPEAPNENVYVDVPKENWASGYINWCKQMNIMGGYGDGTFRPDSPVTYDEALKMVCLILGYTDFDSSLWPVDVRMLALNTLKLGKNIKDVSGSDKLTRGQLAQLLYNALTADMNEAKVGYIKVFKDYDNDGIKDYYFSVPTMVPLTLATDIWNLQECAYTIFDVDNEGTITLSDGYARLNYSLEELGMESYSVNVDSLLGKELGVIYRDAEMLCTYIVKENISSKHIYYTDIGDNKHSNAIKVLTGLGVIGGYEDGTFKPDGLITRADMAKYLYTLSTTFTDAGTVSENVYYDVPQNYWAAGYIKWCCTMGIMGGYGDGTFRPDSPVTYDEALKMVCLILGYTDFDSSLWPTDVRFKALIDLNLGENIDHVSARDHFTRAQMAQLLYNALTADMNEANLEFVIDSDNDGVYDTICDPPIEVAQTLATDVWDFEECVYTIVDIDNNGMITLSISDGYETLNCSIEEIGLQKYSTESLLNKELGVIYRQGELTCNYFPLGSEPDILGDMDGDEAITIDDAIHLAFYTFYPDRYPIPNGMDVDFNGDGEVTIDDAIYLAFYTFYPDRYPIS